MFSPRSKTWTFPSLKGPGAPAEVYLAVEEEEEEPVAFSSFRAVGGEASSPHTGRHGAQEGRVGRLVTGRSLVGSPAPPSGVSRCP